MISRQLLFRSIAMARQIQNISGAGRMRMPLQIERSCLARGPLVQIGREYGTIQVDKPAQDLNFIQMSKLKPSDDLVLIDVREPNEYIEGHIPGAVNIPYKSSPGALGLAEEEFQDTFGFDKPESTKKLVFYCLGGVRSTAAEELAATYGYENRANYKGSYKDWVANNGEVEV